MTLPNEIKEIFYETLNGDRSVLEFEQWLYANRQLEAMMPPDDYMELIAFGYKDRWAKHGLFGILEKHIGDREFSLWKFIRKKYPQGYTPALIKTPFDEQLQRIKEKLITAKNADKDCKVYGSEFHEYVLSVPATENEVLAFERKYSIQLPDNYRAFLLVVGNGGIETEHSRAVSGAGPYIGLYSLDHDREKSKNYLQNDCVIDPDMTTEQWQSLALFARHHTKISGEEYKREADKVFGGILPLGSQGCSYIHALVIKGPHAGRVVNLDYNYIVPPLFAPATNFLDWYEGWLDEVISGSLLPPNSPFYGFP